MLIVTIIGYFIFSAISRTTLAGFANKSDQYICYGTVLGVVILYFLAKRQKKQDQQKLHEARQEWKRTCKSAEVAIVRRHASPGGRYEDGYYPGVWHRRSPSYHLELEMNADQRAFAPNQTTIYVDVKMVVYEQLQEKNTVRIYYNPEAPFVFLLEEEID